MGQASTGKLLLFTQLRSRQRLGRYPHWEGVNYGAIGWGHGFPNRRRRASMKGGSGDVKCIFRPKVRWMQHLYRDGGGD